VHPGHVLGLRIDRYYEADPGLRYEVSQAAGYAVFPEIKKVGVGVGGAYGKGELYENGVKTGYCDVSAGSIGSSSALRPTAS